MNIDADIAIIGSGFGGSLLALIAERLGLRPVLLDRSSHPRFCIGESSTPIANMVLRDLSRRYDLPSLEPLCKFGTAQAAYPRIVLGVKRGFSYFQHTQGQRFAPSGDHERELLVAANLDDYRADTHWMRADVDEFLFREVQAAGILTLENTVVESVVPGKDWRITGRSLGPNQTLIHLKAGMVVDASGQSGVLLRALGNAGEPTRLQTNSRTIYGHFAGVTSWHEMLATQRARVHDYPFPADHAALHHLLDGAWMWQLRFFNDVVSVGLVLDQHRHPLDVQRSPQQEWDQWMAAYPSLAEQFAFAELASSTPRLVRTGRLQRIADHAAGERWAALPNTAGFVDPLHSTGIAQTLCGVERLARIIEEGWGKPALEAGLRQYDGTVQAELEFIDALVSGCYQAMPDFELFASFSMLYFAAATTYEHLHSEGEIGPMAAFLRADHEPLRELVADASAFLRQCQREATAMRPAGPTFSTWLRQRIQPFNIAGLCDPAVHNMYRYTAAPE